MQNKMKSLLFTFQNLQMGGGCLPPSGNIRAVQSHLYNFTSILRLWPAMERSSKLFKAETRLDQRARERERDDDNDDGSKDVEDYDTVDRLVKLPAKRERVNARSMSSTVA